MSPTSSRTRTLWVPEVIQTSTTDCGPASLTSFLLGFGLPANYDHLRDVCYTDVDGTSIDDLEDVAVRCGLDAHQTMVPVEHVFSRDAGTFPSIVVLALPGRVAHFVVLWRRVGPWIQVMDPSGGRRWTHRRNIEEMLYVHRTEVSVDAWRQWAGTEAFLGPLSDRMLQVGFATDVAVQLLDEAVEDESWRSLATLDAATRLIESVAKTGNRAVGQRALQTFSALAGQVPLSEQARWLPERFFSAWRPFESARAPDIAVADEPNQLRLEGVVLIVAEGRREATKPSLSTSPEPPAPLDGAQAAAPVDSAMMQPSLHGVLRRLGGYLLQDGALAPTAVVAAAMIAGFVAAFEALLFKGLLDLGRVMAAPGQRLAAVLVVAIFLGATLLLRLRLAEGVRTLGRRMETRLRMDFLRRLVRLPDSYFQRRLTSDLTLRIHSVVQVRGVPHVGESIIRTLFSLLFVTIGISWVDPNCAPYAAITSSCAVCLPILFQTKLGEMQLAVATYQGGLSRYLLDSLLGALPLRTHVGQGVMRSEHELLLGRWAEARRRLIRSKVVLDTSIAAVGMTMSGVILYVHLTGTGDAASVLLLLFWAQQLPAFGQQLAADITEYPARRAAAARLLEPINTTAEHRGRELEARHAPADSPQRPDLVPVSRAKGVSVRFDGVDLHVGRSPVLGGVSFDLAAGTRCAIVGASGAGKSSLLSLLLGWQRPSRGGICVDDRPLDADGQAALRAVTAWVDPQVQLWNRSLFHNLTYGNERGQRDLAEVIEATGLRAVVEKLPEGLNTPLGDGGGRLSQGEAQRVRLARALGKANVRLVLLDEPLRGLDRPTRASYLDRLADWWPAATILCVTHDVTETALFDRVLVLDGGRLVEDGPPRALARRPDSLYATMCADERRIRAAFDADPMWRRLLMKDGVLHEAPRPTGERGPALVRAVPAGGPAPGAEA